MKKKFSVHWTGSKQPRKQRKYLANAPLHTRHKLMSANLSKELRKKYKKRNFPLRKGDEIRIMRGKFKGKEGKIEGVDLKNLRIMIGGIFRTKKDGTKVSVYFHPSNLQIKELNLDDKKRLESLNRKIKINEEKKLNNENEKNTEKIKEKIEINKHLKKKQKEKQ